MKPSMTIQSVQTTGWLAAMALALGLAGCGGSSSSSSSGNGDTGPSGEELAALAATAGTGAVEDAQDEADEAQEDSSEQSSSQPVALSSHVSQDCDEGKIAGWDDEDTDNPATAVHYDGDEVENAQDLETLIKDGDGSAFFTGTLASGGSFANAQIRANCDDEFDMPDDGTVEFSMHGAMDHVRYELSGLNVTYTVQGGMHPNNQDGDVDDHTTPPSLDPDSFTTEFDGAGSTVNAEMRACEGCPGGDLGSPGDLERDEVFVARMTVEGDQEMSWTLGDESGPLSLVTEHDTGGDGRTHVELNGRLAQEMGGSCSFDAVYDTTEALQVEDYAEEDGGEVRDGKMDITVNGTTYTVEFIDGEVFVDNEPVEVDDFQC